MALSDLKIGLALGGGGARGAYSVGVVDALLEITDIKDFPVVAGTSTGALIATLVCNREFGLLRRLYTEISTENIVNPNHPVLAALLGDTAAAAAAAVFGNQSVFDSDGLADLIDIYADMNKAKARRDACHLILSTVSLQGGEMALFTNRRHAPATLRKALLASASEPVFMPPVRIPGKRGQYVDGGVRELLPIVPIFQSSREKLHAIIAISTNPLGPKTEEHTYDSLTDILARTIDLFVTEVGTNDYEGARRVNALLQIVENAKGQVPPQQLFAGVDPELVRWFEGRRPIPILHVGPEEHIETSSLDFSKDVMAKLMKRGRKEGARTMRPFLKGLEDAPLV